MKWAALAHAEFDPCQRAKSPAPNVSPPVWLKIRERSYQNLDKSSLSPLRLFHFLSLALIAARLLQHDWRGVMTPGMRATIRCGENSLPIYCLGVLLAFIGGVVLRQISSGFAMQLGVSFTGIMVMIAVATLMTWRAKLEPARTQAFLIAACSPDHARWCTGPAEEAGF